jgi:hypothetical protein
MNNKTTKSTAPAKESGNFGFAKVEWRSHRHTTLALPKWSGYATATRHTRSIPWIAGAN